MNNSSTLRNSLMLTPLIGATDSLMAALGLWLMFIVVTQLFGLAMGALRSRLVPATRYAGQHPAGGHAHQLRGTRGASLVAAMAAASGDLWGLDRLAMRRTGPHRVFSERTGVDRLRLCGLFGALMMALGLLRELIGNGTLGNHLPWLARRNATGLARLGADR